MQCFTEQCDIYVTPYSLILYIIYNYINKYKHINYIITCIFPLFSALPYYLALLLSVHWAGVSVEYFPCKHCLLTSRYTTVLLLSVHWAGVSVEYFPCKHCLLNNIHSSVTAQRSLSWRDNILNSIYTAVYCSGFTGLE